MGETALMVNPAAFAFSGGGWGGGSTDREGLPSWGRLGIGRDRGREGGREGSSRLCTNSTRLY